MKQKKHNQNIYLMERKAPRYPNAADREYYVRKVIDIVTAVVSGLGLVSVMLFLVILA